MEDRNHPISSNGEESDNDWYACVQRDICGYIGVHPNGVRRSCPECRSGMEKYYGPLWKCSDCGTEYVVQGDAKDCCA